MQNSTFLVVDDCELLRASMGVALRECFGVHNVYLAADGTDALQLLCDTSVDVIISDWRMTHMDGDELLKRVRSSPRLREIPFIMASANSGQEFVAEARRLGANDYLAKPFTLRELERGIRGALASRGGWSR